MSHAIYTSFTNLIDSNGIPLPSAKVFVFEAGGTTPKTVYSDAALSTPAINPISVSTGGPHDMRYVATGSYKVVVETGGNDTFGSGTVQARYSKDNVDSGVAVGSGALPIASGGTAGTTAAGARTNLGAASSAEVGDIAADVALLQDTLTGTDSTQIAVGTTAQRDISPVAGQIRQNSTTTKFEGYISAGYDNFMLETASATSTANVTAETAEATFTRPDRIKYSPRVAKAVAKLTANGVLQGGFGVTSATVGGSGVYTVNLSITMADTDYSVFVTPVGNSGGGVYAFCTAKTTTTFSLTFISSAGSGSNPSTGFDVIVYGGLP